MQSCQRREISSRCWRQETEGCDLQKSEFLEATRCHQPLSERVRVPNRSPQLTTKTWGLFWLVDFFFRLEGCFGVWKIRTLPFWDPTCTFFFFVFCACFFFVLSMFGHRGAFCGFFASFFPRRKPIAFWNMLRSMWRRFLARNPSPERKARASGSGGYGVRWCCWLQA